MKKYSTKHLESVEPEFIVAIEKTVDLLGNGAPCWGLETCPLFITELGKSIVKRCWCNINLKYKSKDCPCNYFGRIGAINEAENLIQQWKSWAGVE